MMKKNISILLFLFFSIVEIAHSQRIGFIESDKILPEMQAYKEGVQQIDDWAKKYQNQIVDAQSEVAKMKEDLALKSPMMTPLLIKKKEEEIAAKEQKNAELQKEYFGFGGIYFLKRQQLSQEVKKELERAVWKVARKKKLHFIFDKSSDLMLIYTYEGYNQTKAVLAVLKEEYDRKNPPKEDDDEE